jgi:3-deoxy-D-manno-octulosonate 8-phosphate phosphatase (KDO 8-P phosphatase)
LANIAFCGDDVMGLPVMQVCGLSVTPKDAHQLVLDVAGVVLPTNGGHGCAREIADGLLLYRFASLTDIYQPLLDKIA